MSEWKEYKLVELATEFAMGPFGSNIKADNFIESGVPVIRGKNLNFHKWIDGDFVFLSDEKADELIKSNCYPGDLIFTHRGTIGQVGLIPENQYPRYVVSQSGMKLTVDNKKLDGHFLFYFFKSNIGQHELLKNESQVGVPSISSPLSSLKDIDILLPPLTEQKAIAAVLSSMDDKIDLLHCQNKTLEALAETLFRQWFIDEAQDDWEEKPLKELCSINNGFAFKSPTYRESGQKIIRTLNFSNHLIELNKLVFISEELAKSFEKYYLIRNDFLLVMVGANIGNYSIVTKDVLPALQNQNIWCFRAHKNVSQHYLNFALRALITDNLHSASGSARQFFQKAVFYELEIFYPPIEKIINFEKSVEDYFSKIELNKIQILTLEKLRDTLLPKLMSGEVRVADPV